MEKLRIGIDDLKSIQINILDEVDRYCNENHLSYFLCYGTLIGAVRHKGYIPWDDDIDIVMPRDDYEKLMVNFNHEYYKTINPDIDHKYKLSFGKIYDSRTELVEGFYERNHFGVYIDIFPLDGIKDFNNVKKTYILGKLINAKTATFDSRRPFLKNISMMFCKFLLFPFSLYYLNTLVKSIATKESYHGSNTVVNYCSPYVKREIVSREIFNAYKTADFEDRKYRIPIGYDELLRQIYGDYMRLPPEEKRVTHHTFEAWWK